jgi:hypothetical protein
VAVALACKSCKNLLNQSLDNFLLMILAELSSRNMSGTTGEVPVATNPRCDI